MFYARSWEATLIEILDGLVFEGTEIKEKEISFFRSPTGVSVSTTTPAFTIAETQREEVAFGLNSLGVTQIRLSFIHTLLVVPQHRQLIFLTQGIPNLQGRFFQVAFDKAAWEKIHRLFTASMFGRGISWTGNLLCEAWSALGDVPVDEDGIRLDADFVFLNKLIAPRGTVKEDLWHWFDKMHPGGLETLMGLKGEK